MSERALGKGLVLVVEDERPIADLVRQYLVRDGFGVHVEHDGVAASPRPASCDRSPASSTFFYWV